MNIIKNLRFVSGLAPIGNRRGTTGMKARTVVFACVGLAAVVTAFVGVAQATPSSIVAPTAFESCTEKVSFASRLRSPLIETEIVRLVSPGWNVKVPLVAV